jgi:hypothetical protein
MKFSIKVLLSILLLSNAAYAQTASILPPAKTTFVDQNGKPLTSGSVGFYIPNTTTQKTTWQDAAETIPNLNPVILDGAGRALILGSGNYRQIVKDRNGNLIWDQVTSSTGSGGGSSPTATGDGDLVGTIKPWAGLTAPNQYMFTYGEELSRTTYAALFTAITSTQAVFCSSGSPILTGLGDTTNFPIGAKVEIACVVSGVSTIASKTSNSITLADNSNVNLNTSAIIFPWGNGNASTTFNLPDFRGFAIAGNNNMGGVASSILTTQFFGAANPNSIGAAGGSQTSNIVLLAANLPAYTPAGTITNGTITITQNANITNAGLAASGGSGAPTSAAATISASQATSTFAGTPQGGTSTPIASSLIQPTKTSNYIIKVTPDTNSATASGVTSLGGMTGDIACGTNVICTGNTISFNAATTVNISQITGLGTNVETFLVTPTSANLAAAVTDETGSGAAVFGTSPTLVTPNIGAATGTSLTTTSTITGSVIVGKSTQAFNAGGQINAFDITDTNRQVWFGFDPTLEMGYIQAIWQTHGFEPLLLNPNTGGVSINKTTNAAALDVTGSGLFTGSILSNGTAGVGYSTGAGCAVTQASSRLTTTPACNKPSGDVTLFSAAATVGVYATFTVANTTIAANDTVSLSFKSTTNTYNAVVVAINAGVGFNISLGSVSGTSTDAPVLHFNVIKGVNN